MNAELNKAEKEITFAQISVFPNWNRLCIFGPYSTEEEAGKVIGYYSATLAQSAVPSSDHVTALVFINDSGTLGVVDINRSVDFAELSRTCLTPSDFPLAIDRTTGRKIVRRK